MTLSMGIIKVEIKIPELVKAVDVFKNNNLKLFELITTEIKSSVSNTMNQLLQAEFDCPLSNVDRRQKSSNQHPAKLSVFDEVDGFNF
mgnify:FL=1